MKRVPCVFAMVAWGSLVGLSGQAFADVVPAGVKVGMDQWTLCPLREGGTVRGVFAYRADGATSGDNINAVWYVRENNVWVGHGWSNVVIGSAMAHLRNKFAMANYPDTLWDGNGTTTIADYTPAAPPKAYVGGFFADDPLGEAVNESGQADEIKAVLVDIGYAVADVPVETAQEARNLTWQQTLDAIESGTLDYFQTGSAGDGASGYVEASIDMGSLLCLPQTWCTSWSNRVWNCGTWVLAGTQLREGGPIGCLYTRKNIGQSSRTCASVSLFCNVTLTVQTDTKCWDQVLWCPRPAAPDPCPMQPSCSPSSADCAPPADAEVHDLC